MTRLLENKRTIEQLREHYEIEKELANKLRNSSEEERRYLYSSLYDELYKRVSHHPRKKNIKHSIKKVRSNLKILNHFLKSNQNFLELGAGDCRLSFAVAKYVKKVFAIDVSNEITKNLQFPRNVELIISDGSNIPVSKNSINIVFSDQLMEHLHPDDVIKQLQNIYTILLPGGYYICFTPNKLTGPHDISKFFDETPKGFHLREYTVKELSKLFKLVGFLKVRVLINLKLYILLLPVFPIKCIEWILSNFTHLTLKKLTDSRLGILLNFLLGINIIAIK